MSTKKPNRRGRVISAQLPHVILHQLDAIAADMEYTRTEALKFVIQTAFLQRSNVHIFVAPEKTPREAAQLLAQRGRIVQVVSHPGSNGPLLTDHAGDMQSNPNT